MTAIKRFSSALFIVLFLSTLGAQAQTPNVSTVNVTPDEGKVRVAAVGDVLDMRVTVSDESGDIVFESGPAAGDKLDWTMKGTDGARVPAGTYALTVTYRTSSGKLRRRVEQVFVSEEVTSGTSSSQESPTPQAVATITGQGTTGRIAKFTGTNAVGNSALFENGGRIGLGTTAPAQSLHVLGALSRLRLHSTGGSVLTSTEYVNNIGRVWQAGVGGSTAAGVGSKFFIYDQTANQYRLVIDTSGNFGVGTNTPASKLTVNGNIQILGAGNGIKFADGSIQTKAIAGTINGSGTANRLAKFTGPNSFGNSTITEVSGKVGIGTAAPVTTLDVRGNLTLNAGSSPALYTSSLSGEQNRYLQLINSPSSPSASGLKAGGILVADSYDYANPGKNDLIVKGRVGIGTASPGYKLHVEGGADTAVYGISDNSNGVRGVSTDFNGVEGYSSTRAGVQGIGATGVVGISNGNSFVGFCCGGGVARFIVTSNGDVQAHGVFMTGALDLAEMTEVETPPGQGAEIYKPGDVLSISPQTGKLNKCPEPYCRLVAGVYSTKPGFLGGQGIEPQSGNKVPLALVGQVPCKVTDENGPIAIGDLLVTASRPGYAMKGTDQAKMLGAVLGKALEPLASGTGVIKVLLTLR